MYIISLIHRYTWFLNNNYRYLVPVYLHNIIVYIHNIKISNRLKINKKNH